MLFKGYRAIMVFIESLNTGMSLDIVSTKTIEDICQLLQCQPEDLIEWKVDLKPELAYESKFKSEE